ncbi:hypothetical protein [Pontibacter fetidus]|uniref:Uncharacterized protein n=1 Tax=Pontibacter fetidus TaxID=2700082 RepID=A0A6B2H2A2_9BACT|nr:hypothetical protein [Pontibacter fetidus]NDK54756.1 hypothetical protein [Pontibacter fetidus]
MSRSKHKKLYYVPGLISLIMLPLLFAYFGKKEVQKLDVRLMEINFWNPDFAELIPFPEREYTKFILTGDSIKDKAIFTKADLQIKKLYADRDTINGVHFIFQDSASYGSFVNTINNLKENDIARYFPYENNLWVLYPTPTKQVVGELINPPCLLCDDVIVVPPKTKELTVYEQIKASIVSYSSGIKKLWPTIALLFLLVTLTITRAIRHYKPTIV